MPNESNSTIGQTKRPKTMTPYKIAVELCAVQDLPMQRRIAKGIPSSRVSLIARQLKRAKAEGPNALTASYLRVGEFAANLTAYIDLGYENTLVFCAHHDIVNPNTDNIWDNSASVAHLLYLIGYVDLMDSPYNLLFLFTDGEECGGTGAQSLSPLLKAGRWKNIVSIINLELTAGGSQLWLENNSTLGSYIARLGAKANGTSYLNLSCPFNDAVIFRASGLDAVCIGGIQRSTLKRMKKKPSHPTIWGICHSKSDLIEKADKDSMNKWNKILVAIATNYLDLNEWIKPAPPKVSYGSFSRGSHSWDDDGPERAGKLTRVSDRRDSRGGNSNSFIDSKYPNFWED